LLKSCFPAQILVAAIGCAVLFVSFVVEKPSCQFPVAGSQSDFLAFSASLDPVEGKLGERRCLRVVRVFRG
jgi:hypothetical protein